MMFRKVAVMAAVGLLSASVAGLADTKTNGRPSNAAPQLPALPAVPSTGPRAKSESSPLPPQSVEQQQNVVTSKPDQAVAAESQIQQNLPVLTESVSADFGRYPQPTDGASLDLAEDIKDLLKQFQTEQQNYLKTQQELLKNLKGASDAHREVLREQFRLNREQWLETQRKAREDIRERLKELKSELPSKTEVLDGAREQIKEKRDR